MAYQPSIEEHRQQMLEFLARDVADAKSGRVIIGFMVCERHDQAWTRGDCTRIAAIEGLYLPDEMPDLYPADCPLENYCCCVSRVSVLSCDDTPESRLLRKKLADRGLPEPPPPWNYAKELAEVEALEAAKAERIAAAAVKKPDLFGRLIRLLKAAVG